MTPIWPSFGMFPRDREQISGGCRGRYTDEAVVLRTFSTAMPIVECKFDGCFPCRILLIVILLSGVEQADEIVGAMIGCGVEVRAFDIVKDESCRLPTALECMPLIVD